MIIAPFSREQSNLLFFSDAPLNIADGPVRSGKNFIENVRLSKYLYNEPYSNPLSPFVFAGVSKDSVYRNSLRDLFKLLGEGNYSYSLSRGKGKVRCATGWREIYSFAFKDADDFKVLRGDTIGGFLLTEGTLCHPSFFYEIVARKASIDDSCGFIDTNPDSPYHWLYQEYITDEKLLKEKFVKRFQFNLDSNRSLTARAKEILKALYKPGSLLYQRMIEGKWVLAQGLIYDAYDESVNTCEPKDLPGTFDYYVIAGDFGTYNPCVFLLLGIKGNVVYVINEYYYEGRREPKQKTPDEYKDDLIIFVNQNLPAQNLLRSIWIDPTATPLHVALKKHSGFSIKLKAPEYVDNSVLDGIGTVSTMLYQKKIIVSKRCKNTLREFVTYMWDAAASIKSGTDVVKKENDHCLDALRYFCQSNFGKALRQLSGWI